MEVQLAFIASISVLLFFFGSKALSQSWIGISERKFLRNVFIIGLVIRLAWVLYCYFFFNPEHYVTTFGDRADVEWYMPFAKAIAEKIRGNQDITFDELRTIWFSAIDDVGYPTWLAILYVISLGESM